jgi:hypothetical protein
MDVAKAYEFIWFGDIHGPKPYEFMEFCDCRRIAKPPAPETDIASKSGPNSPGLLHPISAELKWPRIIFKIRPGIFDFEPGLGLKRSQTEPPIPGTVPTDRRTTSPNDSGTISRCFDYDPKLFNCETAQPSNSSEMPLLYGAEAGWLQSTALKKAVLVDP